MTTRVQPHLNGKTAVVTGASRGIGANIAIALAAHGAKVVLVARSAVPIQQLELGIRNNGGAALAVPCDVSITLEVEQLADLVHNAFGPVHILINAAGFFGPVGPIARCDASQWISTLMINTVGPFLTCHAFVGDMLASGWGRIINVSSAATLHKPGPGNSAYGASKAALNQFTRHLASELIDTGVTANVIHPGEVKTDMWAYIRDEYSKTGPEGEGYRNWAARVNDTGGDPPEKSAELVMKLVSDDAGAISGQFLWIEDGLQKPVPSW